MEGGLDCGEPLTDGIDNFFFDGDDSSVSDAVPQPLNEGWGPGREVHLHLHLNVQLNLNRYQPQPAPMRPIP